MENIKQDYDNMIQIVNKPVTNVYQISHEDLIKICSSAFNYGMFATDVKEIIKEVKQEFIEIELPYLLQNLTK